MTALLYIAVIIEFAAFPYAMWMMWKGHEDDKTYWPYGKGIDTQIIVSVLLPPYAMGALAGYILVKVAGKKDDSQAKRPFSCSIEDIRDTGNLRQFLNRNTECVILPDPGNSKVLRIQAPDGTIIGRVPIVLASTVTHRVHSFPAPATIRIVHKAENGAMRYVGALTLHA